MRYFHDLTLGLPHTNHRGLAEALLLKHAGHFQWSSIAAAIGVPLSHLRTAAGEEVYAAFYYVEERLPPAIPLESFGLDDVVRFAIDLRAFKNIAVEGRIVFDRPERMPDAAGIDHAIATGAADSHPFIRFGNIFISPSKGNSALAVAPPIGVDFSVLPPLPNDENPYHLTRAAGNGQGLGVLDAHWSAVGSYDYHYLIDVDRDTNGAGLVYFANYVVFMETAERVALGRVATPFPPQVLARRSLRHRRIGYYGNADVDDRIAVRVTVLLNHAIPGFIGFRCRIERQDDQKTICVSEAVKAIPPDR